MAVVDCETTGLQPYYNDVIQVCVLPINSDFEMLENVLPFYGEMKAKRPENFNPKESTLSRAEFVRIMTDGVDPDRMADLFQEWFEQLPLPHNKSLAPLAHNWAFDLQFMTDWLGYHAMQRYFHGHYRDLMVAGIYENDKAAFNIHPYPYPKHGLSYYCSQLGVQNAKAHDSLHDCIATARCYKRVVMAGAYTPVNPQPENVT